MLDFVVQLSRIRQLIRKSTEAAIRGTADLFLMTSFKLPPKVVTPKVLSRYSVILILKTASGRPSLLKLNWDRQTPTPSIRIEQLLDLKSSRLK